MFNRTFINTTHVHPSPQQMLKKVYLVCRWNSEQDLENIFVFSKPETAQIFMKENDTEFFRAYSMSEAEII